MPEDLLVETSFPDRISFMVGLVGSKEKLGKMAGLSAVMVGKYASGQSEPSRDKLISLAEAGGVSVAWLTTGEGPVKPEGRGHSHALETAGSWDTSGNFILVPRYDVAASAGGGSVVHSEQVVDHLAFKREWVSSIGLQHDQLALISATGDSMEPTINDGDLLLVDTRTIDAITEGVYVLRMDDALLAKRLQYALDGGLIVRSDNKIYQELKADKDQIQFLDIIGRVVWTGGRM